MNTHELEVKFSFIRSPGPGGQNVNKVATGVLLRFNVVECKLLDEEVKTRLIKLVNKKINSEGELIIKAVSYRTQERNKQAALARLAAYIQQAEKVPKPRKKTKPTAASQERRLNSKKLHGKNKALRKIIA